MIPRDFLYIGLIMSVNKAILIGNLGKDPEVRYSPGGAAVCNLSVATTHRVKDQSGQWNEQTEWHRVTLFGKTAEVAGQYLAKGRPVYIEGRIQTRKWQDQSGQDRYTTEIIADQMQMLGGRGDENQSYGQPQPSPNNAQNSQPQQSYATESGASSQRQRSYQAQPPSGMADMDDDIPFNAYFARSIA